TLRITGLAPDICVKGLSITTPGIVERPPGLGVEAHEGEVGLALADGDDLPVPLESEGVHPVLTAPEIEGRHALAPEGGVEVAAPVEPEDGEVGVVGLGRLAARHDHPVGLEHEARDPLRVRAEVVDGETLAGVAEAVVQPAV